MWMRSEDGLAAALYGPSEVHTRIDGHAVHITEETEYPFRELVTLKVKLAQPHSFALHLRIPEWCDGATIRINGRASAAPAAAGTFAVVKREFRDGDVITLRLPMKVAVEKWFAGRAAVIRRGPLVYSLQIAEKSVESMQEPEAIQRVLKGNNVEGFPAIEFFPASEWRYGVDAALADRLELLKVKELPLGENPFLVETAPMRLTVPLRKVAGWAKDWKPVMDRPPEDLKDRPKNPLDLPSKEEMQLPGRVETMTLVPYGATHLRVTTFPVIG
jgi:hypothetical protein